MLEAQRERPSDPWPRGKGHVVLALPESLEVEKAYHEPGGSFSPEFGSFGVSFWITDERGLILRTSDSIPMEQVAQRFEWHKGSIMPSIRTDTDEYVSDWRVGPGLGLSHLQLTPRLSNGHKLIIAIRSVGPAGAAVNSLVWTNHELVVNGRYILRVASSNVSVYVGTEGPSGWTTAPVGSSNECHSQSGWCFARLELQGDSPILLSISDKYPRRGPALTTGTTRSDLTIELPDRHFRDSLEAQVAHLMMGTSEYEPRPGEPNNYPLAWLRDGAYQVVALARAGQLDTARDLVHYFTDKDFFGGFGAEGDGPGLSLWAMEEVAVCTNNRSYDRFLWPHVYRKAEFILGMQSTKETIQRIFAGPLVPIHRAEPDVYDLAKPPENGLIKGRMDLHFPTLYATAVSYNGLICAAALADRLGYGEDARRWRSAAAMLKGAWNRAYSPTDPAIAADDYTFISSQWPTWIVSDRESYLNGLDRLWAKEWDAHRGDFKAVPLWTYFTFSIAHQYLFMGKQERSFQVLQWFWDHQPSPGLYSWWEGNGEENAFHEWEYVRGWVNPPHVTPHYWAAAQCLLLQIDMLTYVDDSSASPTIIIGAGIPASWISKPMSVRGVLTKLGKVDWTWDGKNMIVVIHGSKVPAKLGPGFPGDARIIIRSDATGTGH